LRGRQYLDLRRKSLSYALEMFNRAVEIDPEYASAHAGIADCISLLYLLFDTDPEQLAKADAASARALELEPDLAESHAARGMVYSCRRDYEKGNREFELAMRLDPKFFEAPYFWGRNLIWQGLGEDAIRVFRVAQALRPESYEVASMISAAYSSIGKHADAKAARMLATRIMTERLELNPDDPRAWVLLATNYGSEGDEVRAKEAIRRALAIDDDALTVYNVACAYALLKDEDNALDALESAIAKGWHHREWLEHDADFDFVRNSPRYKSIATGIQY
jgi:adenylate cyclase